LFAGDLPDAKILGSNPGGYCMSLRQKFRVRINRILAVLVTGAVLIALPLGIAIAAQDRYTVAVPDGLGFSDFRGYETWQVVSVSQHPGIIDVILGNPVMIEAYKSGIPGNGKPFPDGAKLAKIHWNSKKFSDAFPVQSPDSLHDIDFMARDSKRFAGDDHWGFAQFNYDNATDSFSAQGKGPGCGTACHQAAAKTDFVFTEFPKR
jgi:hypothetical protein